MATRKRVPYDRDRMFKCWKCGKGFKPTRNQLKSERKGCRPFCSKACRYLTQNKEHGEFMRKNNSMWKPGVKEKMSATLQRIGHKPKIQGGKGRGLTKPQSILLEALGDGWIAEKVLKTGLKKGEGATWYSADLYHEATRLIVEVDGNSHFSTKDRDQRRDVVLSSLGYQTLRFRNDAILQELSTTCKLIRQKITSLMES